MNLSRLFMLIAFVLELIAVAIFAGWVTSSEGFTFLAAGLAVWILAVLVT